MFRCKQGSRKIFRRIKTNEGTAQIGGCKRGQDVKWKEYKLIKRKKE